MSEKNFYIIAGCNGAGKITASFTILPEVINCKEFINADEIARGLSPFQPENLLLKPLYLLKVIKKKLQLLKKKDLQ